MKIKKILLIFSLLILFLSGCVKENFNTNQIVLKAEGFVSNTKAIVSDKYTYWNNNDDVLVNNRIYCVSVSSDNEAIISSVTESETYSAIYPANIYVSNAGTSYTLDIPHHYIYKEFNNKQVLDGLPMMAYYNNSNNPEEFIFKHITAAFTVRVKNERSETIELDRIEIINNQYKLGGLLTVDVTTCENGNTPTISPIKQNASDTISIHFTDIKKSVAQNDYIDIQVPTLPVGSDNSIFTVNVYGHQIGSRYTYSRSTDSRNNAIGRACLGYIVTKYTSDSPVDDLFDTESIVIDGVVRNFFEIHSPDELVTLSNAMDSMWTTHDGEAQYNQANYVVVNDIDMHGATLTPIHYYNLNGNERCYFDGQGHTISNFVASSAGENEPNCCGFFGRTAGDSITVKNLNIDNATYEFAHVAQTILSYDNNPCSAVGGIYAVVDKDGIVIENCTVTNIKMGAIGNVMSGENQTDFYASGIVGLAHHGVTIRNCYIGCVDVDNSHDASSKALVDQFGAAIGRIDVGNSNGNNTYEKAGDNCAKMIIENVTYEQGSTPLVFDAELKNIRYGGLVANITRGGILKIINCTVSHNVIVYKPTANLYCGGLIGCNKLGLNMGFYLDENCKVSGNIENRAVNSYTSAYQIEKYIGNGVGKIVKIDNSASTCNNTLTVSGNTTTFKSSNQHF